MSKTWVLRRTPAVLSERPVRLQAEIKINQSCVSPHSDLTQTGQDIYTVFEGEWATSHYIMPSAPIGTNTYLYYEDSGVPQGIEYYTTIVIVHGLSFNSGIFTPMLSFAPKNRVRIVTVNMRDYSGSTPYTDRDLADLVDKNIEVQTQAVGRVGREIATFLVYVCTELSISPITLKDGKKDGGLALMTWSLYTMGFLSMFGDAEVLDQDMKARLSPFFRKAILHDPPFQVYGAELEVPGLTHPFIDTSVPAAEKPATFLKWVTSYFTPTPDESPSTITPDTLIARSTYGAPTSEKMSQTDIQRIVEPEVIIRSGALLMTAPEIHRCNTENTFFDAEGVLPEVDVLVLWCDSSIWTTILGAKFLDGLRQSGPRSGKRKRNVSMLKIKGANHMYHWDEPEKMVQLLVENV